MKNIYVKTKILWKIFTLKYNLLLNNYIVRTIAVQFLRRKICRQEYLVVIYEKIYIISTT